MTSLEERKARYRYKEAVLRRVLANTDLIRQIEESLEARRRGERAVPFKEIRRKPDDAFIEVVGLSKLDG